jgi:hypothetical protein
LSAELLATLGRTALLAAIALAGASFAAPAAGADVDWQPTGPGSFDQARVLGDVEVTLSPAGVRVRGWLVDAVSATQPDAVEVVDTAGRQLASVSSGEFDLNITDPPHTLVVLAHLGQLGWWQATVVAPVPRRARLVRLECVTDDRIDVEVTSAEPFPVRDALFVLQTGSVTSTYSRYPDDGDLHTLIFTLTSDQLATISPADVAYIRFSPGLLADSWEIGPIDPASATLQACV